MKRSSFRPRLESLDGRCLPSGNPAILIDDVAITEGHQGRTALVFTVSLSEATSKTVSVKYATANGAGRAGDGDFVGKSGTLKFAPGETTRTIIVWVNGDANVESNEGFFVNLSQARNARIADARGIGTILNDDFFVPPTTGGCSIDNPCTDPGEGNPDPGGGGF